MTTGTLKTWAIFGLQTLLKLAISLFSWFVAYLMIAGLIESQAWPMIPFQILWCLVVIPFMQATDYLDLILRYFALRFAPASVDASPWQKRLLWLGHGSGCLLLTIVFLPIVFFPTVFAVLWYGPVPIPVYVMALHCATFGSLYLPCSLAHFKKYVDSISVFMKQGRAWDAELDKRARASITGWKCPNCGECFEPDAFMMRRTDLFSGLSNQSFHESQPLVVLRCTHCQFGNIFNAHGEPALPQGEKWEEYDDNEPSSASIE